MSIWGQTLYRLPLLICRAEKPEKKKWLKIGQFAARRRLLEPGDYVVSDNADRTFLIVRQDDGGVRAFNNVCLRGRKLRTEDIADKFQCPSMDIPE